MAEELVDWQQLAAKMMAGLVKEMGATLSSQLRIPPSQPSQPVQPGQVIQPAHTASLETFEHEALATGIPIDLSASAAYKTHMARKEHEAGAEYLAGVRAKLSQPPQAADSLGDAVAANRAFVERAASGTHTFTQMDDPIPDDIDEDDLLRQAISWQESYTRRFKAVLEHDVVVRDKATGLPYTGKKPIALALPSDWHIGNKGTDHKRIIEDIEVIVNHPRLYCSVGGDPVDNFVIEKMISASREQIFQVDVQWALFRTLVKKLVANHSLLFVGAGNHDAWTYKVAGIDGIQAALAGINVVNTKEGGLVRLQVGDQPYALYRKHKPTRFNSGYNPHHFLEQMLRMGTPWDWDIGVSEHFHHAHIKWGDGTDGTTKERVFITTGSYKVDDAYAQALGYYGGGYGVPCVLLFPDRREMWPVARLEQAVRILDSF